MKKIKSQIKTNAPLNSLENSNVNLKVEAMEEKKVRVCSLICNISKHAWALWWGLGQVTSRSIIHMDIHKSNNKLVST